MVKGLIHVYTGDGKGKTTAAVGLAIRAAGQKKKVLFVQFFKKEDASSGEKEIFRSRIKDIELIRSDVRHPMFTRERTDKEKLKESVVKTLTLVGERVKDKKLDLLVLDEINCVISGGWARPEDIVVLLNKRHHGLEVVLTGRNAPPEIIMLADYVTEMLKIKHPFDSGTGARRGIEY